MSTPNNYYWIVDEFNLISDVKLFTWATMDRYFLSSIFNPNNCPITKRWKHIMDEHFFSKTSYV
jgi:hypothetical protein